VRDKANNSKPLQSHIHAAILKAFCRPKCVIRIPISGGPKPVFSPGVRQGFPPKETRASRWHGRGELSGECEEGDEGRREMREEGKARSLAENVPFPMSSDRENSAIALPRVSGVLTFNSTALTLGLA